MDLERYGILEKFSAYSVCVPAFLCILKFRALNKSLWALFFYLLLCMLADYLSWVYNGSNGNFVRNGFTLFEFIFVVFIYYEQLENTKLKLATLIVSLLFIVSCVFILTFQKKYNSTDTTLGSIESAIISILASSYLLIFLLDPKIVSWSKHYFYWINLGFLLYFSSGILLFLTFNFLKTCKPSTLYLIWGIHLLLNTIKNVLFATGIWMKKNTQ
ncbi:MAG: hypothetical protein JNJ41_11500 [Bacteroidia bacterium]|nr:hypothetical protein [Bacteroidia bacterium]